MTTTRGNSSSNLTGKPPVVDLATWQTARDELLVREMAHTHEGNAIAAARRRSRNRDRSPSAGRTGFNDEKCSQTVGCRLPRGVLPSATNPANRESNV
jgi:hypothetical protein